jgi:hypothetical protein
MAEPGRWTAALVLRGLRRHFARQLPLGERVDFAFLLQRARAALGERSAEYRALTLRCAPAAQSIRELVREKYGWSGSRSELYRRSRNGAVRVAVALANDGVPVPTGLLPAGTCQ